MRKLETNIGITFKVKQDKTCVFCKNCTDFFYDSHGVYMICCALNDKHADDHNFYGTCENFIDDYEETGRL